MLVDKSSDHVERHSGLVIGHHVAGLANERIVEIAGAANVARNGGITRRHLVDLPRRVVKGARPTPAELSQKVLRQWRGDNDVQLSTVKERANLRVENLLDPGLYRVHNVFDQVLLHDRAVIVGHLADVNRLADCLLRQIVVVVARLHRLIVKENVKVVAHSGDVAVVRGAAGRQVAIEQGVKNAKSLFKLALVNENLQFDLLPVKVVSLKFIEQANLVEVVAVIVLKN